MCQPAYLTRAPVRADIVLIRVPILALPALAIHELLQLGDIRVIGSQLLQSGDVRRGVVCRATSNLDPWCLHTPISVIIVCDLALIIFARLSFKYESTVLARYRLHSRFRPFTSSPINKVPLIYRFHATHRSVSG